jgi:hypothetical protein
MLFGPQGALAGRRNARWELRSRLAAEERCGGRIWRYDACPFDNGAIMAKAKKKLALAWSKEDVRNLRSLAKAKLSGTQIAKRLKRSPGAVSQKAMRLKVRLRSVRRKAG